jgi:hypothetical protein
LSRFCQSGRLASPQGATVGAKNMHRHQWLDTDAMVLLVSVGAFSLGMLLLVGATYLLYL